VVSKLKQTIKNLYNIFHAASLNILKPHGFTFCDVAKYSLLTWKLFCHMDKGLVSKHTNYYLLEVFMGENGGSKLYP
jgi:hypothetical protein